MAAANRHADSGGITSLAEPAEPPAVVDGLDRPPGQQLELVGLELDRPEARGEP
jgi:hypothetical protein